MDKTFEEWCGLRVCSECRYEKLSSRDDCRNAYKEDFGAIKYSEFQRLENKIDAIIKHFNIPVE